MALLPMRVCDEHTAGLQKGLTHHWFGFSGGQVPCLTVWCHRRQLQHRGLADGNMFFLRENFEWEKNYLPKLA